MMGDKKDKKDKNGTNDEFVEEEDKPDEQADPGVIVANYMKIEPSKIQADPGVVVNSEGQDNPGEQADPGDEKEDESKPGSSGMGY